MKFTIEAKDLKAITHRVGVAVERKCSIPVLEAVCLEATEDGQIIMRGTNMDIWVSAKCEAEVETKGSCTIPLRRLASFLGEVSGSEKITIERAGDDPKSCDISISTVTSEGIPFSWNAEGFPPEDFPTDPVNMDNMASVEVSTDTLREMFQRVKFAISTEETRYYLNGIYLHRVGERINAVATDGHRLALLRMKTGGVESLFPEDGDGIIVPRVAIAAILANLPKQGDNRPAKFSMAKQDDQKWVPHIQVQIGDGDFVLTTKMIDGTYPDYNRVVPDVDGSYGEVQFDRNIAARIFRMVGRVAGEKIVCTKLEIDNGGISVKTSEHYGNVHARFAAAYNGDPKETGFNANYAVDMCANLRGDVVKMSILDASSPVLITTEADPDFSIVQMPMRI